MKKNSAIGCNLSLDIWKFPSVLAFLVYDFLHFFLLESKLHVLAIVCFVDATADAGAAEGNIGDSPEFSIVYFDSVSIAVNLLHSRVWLKLFQFL